jgi:transketolase N-terminal domain/subunit
MSDGEQDAGNTWEAAMFAGNNKLHNLTAIIDRNNIQINGMTEHVMPLENLARKSTRRLIGTRSRSTATISRDYRRG